MNVGGDWHESKRGEGGKNCRKKKVSQPHFRFPPPFLGVQKKLFFALRLFRQFAKSRSVIAERREERRKKRSIKGQFFI